jgi:membrane-associated phospholipid phosphatase
MIALAAAAAEHPGAWRYASVYVVLAVVTPLVYLVWLLRHGYVSDLDVKARQERWRPLLAALGGLALSTVIFWLTEAPREMSAVCAALWLYTLLAFVITLRWKISMHSAAMAATAILIWALSGRVIVPVAAGIPIIAWARIRLNRHTPAQTVAGALLGGLIMASALHILVY